MRGGMLACLLLLGACAPRVETQTVVLRLLPPDVLMTVIEIPPWNCSTNGDLWQRCELLEHLLKNADIDRAALRRWRDAIKKETTNE